MSFSVKGQLRKEPAGGKRLPEGTEPAAVKSGGKCRLPESESTVRGSSASPCMPQRRVCRSGAGAYARPERYRWEPTRRSAISSLTRRRSAVCTVLSSARRIREWWLCRICPAMERCVRRTEAPFVCPGSRRGNARCPAGFPSENIRRSSRSQCVKNL